MADPVLTIGRVQIRHRGEYSPTVQYTLLNVVSHLGGSYMALQAVTGIAPPNPMYWGVIALPGKDGADGTDGREIDIRNNGTYIQWRYVDESTWTNIESIENLRGPKGDTGDTGPQGIQGIMGPIGLTGPKGETGRGFTILGFFLTLDDLKHYVTDPYSGDAYGVGTTAPYDIYIYDADQDKWVNNGPLQGAPGDPGVGIESITRTSGTGAPGTVDTYTITKTDGSTSTFKVTNGANGRSAYEIAVEVGGFIGTEAQFAAYLARAANAQPRINGEPVALPATGWTQAGDRYTRTVSVSWLPADSDKTVTDIDPFPDSIEEWGAISARVESQPTGALIVSAFMPPEFDLMLVVTLTEVYAP